MAGACVRGYGRPVQSPPPPPVATLLAGAAGEPATPLSPPLHRPAPRRPAATAESGQHLGSRRWHGQKGRGPVVLGAAGGQGPSFCEPARAQVQALSTAENDMGRVALGVMKAGT